MSDSANVFVSHIHEDDAEIAKMKRLLSSRGYEVRDSSINATRPNNARDPDYIKHQILAPKIRWAGKMIVLISPETKDSDYVRWEIDYATKTDTRIIGIFTRGSEDCDVPEGLEDYADGIVAWDGDALLAALRGEDVWQGSSGTPRARRDIARHNC